MGGVRLDEYLRSLVGEVASAYGASERGIAVSTEADPIEVALDNAVPLAFTVTEAISNAFRHAFPEGEGGRIDVSARSRVDGFKVTVRDSGGGRPAILPVPERGTSMGSRLIQTFAAQIDGTVSYENDNGTVFRIRVPIKESSP